MEQTAVEWLELKLDKIGLNSNIIGDFIEQAKEIENQQKGYSEKQLLDTIKDYDREFKLDTSSYTKPCSFTIEEWFEQFKKK